jgi:hypothetical protein
MSSYDDAVANWPPLTPEARDRLAVLLRPAVMSKPDPKPSKPINDEPVKNPPVPLRPLPRPPAPPQKPKGKQI